MVFDLRFRCWRYSQSEINAAEALPRKMAVASPQGAARYWALSQFALW
jgi:hypothetical protein